MNTAIPRSVAAQAGTAGHACDVVVPGSGSAGFAAAGNDTSPSMDGTYPGPGITIGPALTFGYIAERLAASAPAHPRKTPSEH